MHIQHINNINPCMVASVTRILFRPYLFKSVFAYHCVKAPGSNKRTACNHHFHQKCHPQCVWSRDVTNQSFQVAGRNNRTTCILPLKFYHMPSGRSEHPDNWHLPFISQSFRMASPNNRIACVSPFTFIMIQVASPKQTDNLNLSLSCFEWSVLNNGQFEFIFILFQAVSPKQWTAWVYLFKLFRAVSPKQWTVRVYFCHVPSGQS